MGIHILGFTGLHIRNDHFPFLIASDEVLIIKTVFFRIIIEDLIQIDKLMRSNHLRNAKE